MTRRDALLVVITGFVVAAGVAAGVIALSPDRTATVPTAQPTTTSPGYHLADPGIKACEMMHEDKASGNTPNAERSAEEISLMRGSGNKNLNDAAEALASGDIEAGMNALDKLYSGCTALGSSI
jgi:hypothetical protein